MTIVQKQARRIAPQRELQQAELDDAEVCIHFTNVSKTYRLYSSLQDMALDRLGAPRFLLRNRGRDVSDFHSLRGSLCPCVAENASGSSAATGLEKRRLRGGSYVSHNATLGDYVFVGANATILARDVIGEGVHFAPNAVCRELLTVGQYALVGIRRRGEGCARIFRAGRQSGAGDRKNRSTAG